MFDDTSLAIRRAESATGVAAVLGVATMDVLPRCAPIPSQPMGPTKRPGPRRPSPFALIFPGWSLRTRAPRLPAI